MGGNRGFQGYLEPVFYLLFYLFCPPFSATMSVLTFLNVIHPIASMGDFFLTYRFPPDYL